jgi:hypothetical protein
MLETSVVAAAIVAVVALLAADAVLLFTVIGVSRINKGLDEIERNT